MSVGCSTGSFLGVGSPVGSGGGLVGGGLGGGLVGLVLGLALVPHVSDVAGVGVLKATIIFPNSLLRTVDFLLSHLDRVGDDLGPAVGKGHAVLASGGVTGNTPIRLQL